MMRVVADLADAISFLAAVIVVLFAAVGIVGTGWWLLTLLWGRR